MGLLQATEVLKLLLGIGETLAGRLLLFDALDGTFTELRLRRDPKCPVCSDEAKAAREAGTPLPIPDVFAPSASEGADARRSACSRSAGRGDRRQARGDPAQRRRRKEVAASGATDRRGPRRARRRVPGAAASQLLTPDGELHRFVNVYLNGQDVRYLDGRRDTPVARGRRGDRLLPAMAGGAG